MDKISVIIPFYNSQKYILQCVNSVICQTYKDIEIILINNNSIDDTEKLIEKIKDKRIKIYKCKEKGVAYARNLGIKKATGRYICFLDSDDFWSKEKLEKQLKFMKNNNYKFIYSNYQFVKEENKKGKVVAVPKSLTYNQAIKNTVIFTSTVMIDTKYIKKELIYMPLIKRGQDTATWWQILKTGITAYGLNETLVYYRVQNNSLSSNKLKALYRTWQIYKMQDLNLLKRIYCFICYILRAILRRI